MTAITWLNGCDDISESVWNKTLSESDNDNLFLTWEWLSTWWRHFGDAKESLLLIAKDDNNLVAIAPLMLSKHRVGFVDFNLVQFMGTGLSDYGDFILTGDKKRILNLFFDFLDEQGLKWDLMDLRNIPSDSGTARLLEDLARNRGYALITKKTPSQSIRLDQTWEDYFKNLSGNLRKQLRQNLRRVEERYSGDLKYTQDPSSSMGAFLDTYGKWLVERHGQSSLFDIPLRDVGEFLTDFTRRSAEKGWISLSFLMLDQKPASSYYGFTYDNCFYLYMTGWDPKYSHYGVGNIHTMSLIKRSIELGLERFDLLRGDERYKERWNPIRKSNVRVILLKKTLKGRLCYRLLKAMEHRRTKSFLERFGIGEN